MKAGRVLACSSLLPFSAGVVCAQEADREPLDADAPEPHEAPERSHKEPGWRLDFGGKGGLVWPVLPDLHGARWGSGAFVRGRLPGVVVVDGSLTLWPDDPRHPNRKPEDSLGLDATLTTMFHVASIGDVQLFIGAGVGFSLLSVSDPDGAEGEDALDPARDDLLGQHVSTRALLTREVAEVFVVFLELDFQGYSLGYNEEKEPSADDDDEGGSFAPDMVLVRGALVMVNVGLGLSLGL